MTSSCEQPCGPCVVPVRVLAGAMHPKESSPDSFITLGEPTGQMLREAVETGTFHSQLTNRDYQRVRLATFDDMLHEPWSS